MKSLVLRIREDEPPVRVVVERATVRAGALRGKLIAQAAEHEDISIRYIALAVYPAIVAGTRHIEGYKGQWPPDFEEFLEWPEDVVEEWFSAALAENPHWSDAPKAPTPPPSPTQ